MSDWRISPSCNRALHGWPITVAPCVGYIESDYDPGSFYPCATCNPSWKRAKFSELAMRAAAVEAIQWPEAAK